MLYFNSILVLLLYSKSGIFIYIYSACCGLVCRDFESSCFDLKTCKCIKIFNN